MLVWDLGARTKKHLKKNLRGGGIKFFFGQQTKMTKQMREGINLIRLVGIFFIYIWDDNEDGEEVKDDEEKKPVDEEEEEEQAVIFPIFQIRNTLPQFSE